MPETNNFEEIELSGHKYKFYISLPAMKAAQFRYAYISTAKKIIYSAMLELNEISGGYQMIESKHADAWIRKCGFEDLYFLRAVSEWIGEPLDFKRDDKGEIIKDKENNPIPVKSLFDAVIEAGEDGRKIFQLFFIKLTLPIVQEGKKQESSKPSSPKAGTGKKRSSAKESQSV